MNRLLTYFSIIFTITLVSSCAETKDQLLIGTWEEVETGNSKLVYNADGTFFYDFADGTSDHGTWRFDGSTLYIRGKGRGAQELEEEVTTLNHKEMVSVVAGMFQTKYKRLE